MRKEKNQSGYQYLNNDFWKLCEDRKIYRLPQHLYIYLRGKYCRFGPEFYCSDVELRRCIGICRNTFRKARGYLQERGLILFKEGGGKTWTHYTMLDSNLLPNIKRGGGSKNDPQRVKNQPLEGQKMTLSIYRVNNRVKNKVSVSHTKKKFKRYNPNSKQSLKYKNRLKELLEN